MNKKIGNINFVETAVGTYAIRMDSFRDSLTHLFGSAVSDWDCSPATVAGIRIVPWGADNSLPSYIRNLLEKNNLAPAGRALALQARGHRFEPCCSHHRFS